MSDDDAAEPAPANAPANAPPAPPDDRDKPDPPEDDRKPADPEEPPAPDRDSIVKSRQRGESRNLKRARQAAENAFAQAQVYGPAAGGDVTINNYGSAGGRGAARTFRLLDEQITEIEATFVEPADFAAIRREFADDHQRVVILQGPEGCGRYAAARRLLSGHRPVYGIASGTSLSELTEADLAPGAGYILSDLTRQEARNVTGIDIDRLNQMLTVTRSRLVVTAPTGPLGDETARRRAFKLGQVADRTDIVHLLLRHHLGADQADEIMAQPGVERLITEELSGDGPPAHAGKVATEVIRAYRDDLPIRRTVEAVLQQSDEDRTRQWFEGLGKRSVQCMALAVAVLGGEPYETVSYAAELLRRRLLPPGEIQASADDKEAPLVDDRHMLDALGAHLVSGTTRTFHDAEAPADLVHYLDSKAQRKVLLYAFRAFGRERTGILDWIRSLASNDLESARFRVAAATGLLAARSYDVIRTAVILSWARAPLHKVRSTAAFALAFAARDENIRDAVRSTLKGWAEEDDDPRLRATSARAWQVVFEAEGGGATGAQEALDMLGTASADDDFQVIDAVCESLSELWEEVGEDLKAPETLLKWLGDNKEPQRRFTAKLAFLLSAVDLIEEIPGPAGTVEWPKLLHIAAADPAQGDDIATLWRRTLASPEVGRTAKKVLAGWVKVAEPEPAMRRSLLRLLLTAVGDDENTGERIRQEAVKWAEDAPGFSREVRKALARKVYR